MANTYSNVDTTGKYVHSTPDAFKRLNNSSEPAILSRRNLILCRAKDKRSSACTVFQHRYVVTLFGFLMYFQITCYRIATSMSVVKMVNSTAVGFKKNLNGTIDSCPLHNSSIEEFSETVAEGEFNWSPQIQGYILSAGFLGYVVSQIPGGMLAEAYGAKQIFISGILISSLVHMFCPFATWYSCNLMIAMQFLRGVGQGLLSPSCFIIAAKWFPRPERGFMNSCIFQGCSVGSVIAYAVSGSLCSSKLLGGWPLVYFIFGGLGLLFALSAHLLLYESPKEHPRIREAELIYILENQETDFSQKPPTPWRKILTSVPVHAMIFAIFADFWALSQQLAEHPIFLGNILHISIQTNGILNSIPFLFQIVVTFLGGCISKWLNTHGYVGVDKARKGSTMLYSLGYSISLLGMYFVGCDRTWNIVCSIIGFSLSGLSYTGCVIVPTDMSPTFAGSLFALSNTVASSATFIFPIIVGAMMDVEESLEQWRKVFLICIAVVMSSGILFCVFGSAEVQPWNFPSKEDLNRNRHEDDVLKKSTKECTLSIETSTHL